MPRKAKTTIPEALKTKLADHLPSIQLHLKAHGYTSYPALDGLMALEELAALVNK